MTSFAGVKGVMFVLWLCVFWGGGSSCALAAEAPRSVVKIQNDAAYRYMASNGVPVSGAVTGTAPQSYLFRIPLKGVAASAPTMMPDKTAVFGVALDGVPITSPTYLGASGAFLYHGIPAALVKKDFAHVGYAADGFPIFVSTKALFHSSYDSAGVYKAGSGNLDQCNGVTVNKQYYIYVLTPEFPKVPLCWSGTPDRSFLERLVPAKPKVAAQPTDPAAQAYPQYSTQARQIAHEQDSIRRRNR